MNWFKPSFSSKLNFSLTKKRLSLIGKRSSVSRLYFKALPVLVAFAFSPFLFFDQKDESDNSFEIKIKEYWYSKNLEGGFRAIEFSSAIDGIAYKAEPVLFRREGDKSFKTAVPYQQISIQNVYTENKDLFTGTQRFINRVTGEVGWENVYKRGVLTSKTAFADSLINFRGVVYTNQFLNDSMHFEQIEYDTDGNILYRHILTETEFRTFGSNNELLHHSYTAEIDGNIWTYNKWWYTDGQLSSEWARDTLGIQGLMTLYDEEGTIIRQTDYKNGRLIERIK